MLPEDQDIVCVLCIHCETVSDNPLYVLLYNSALDTTLFL